MNDEFEKLVNDERVDQSLIKQTEFLWRFKNAYDSLSYNGTRPVKVDINKSGNVVLSNDIRVPARDDGTYSGGRQITQYKFYLGGSEKDYFCEEIESVDVKYPQNVDKPKKSISASKRLKVYKFNQLIANSWNCVFSKMPLDYDDVYAMAMVPDVDLRYTIRKMLPNIDEDLLGNTNYVFEVARSENGIASMVSRRKEGWLEPVWEQRECEGHLTPGYETLENGIGTMYYSHAKVNSKDGKVNKEETFLDSHFNSVEEARTYFSNYYTNEGSKRM